MKLSVVLRVKTTLFDIVFFQFFPSSFYFGTLVD